MCDNFLNVCPHPSYCQLLCKTASASAEVLTDAFNWGHAETIQQHDVSEMLTLFLQDVEKALKVREFRRVQMRTQTYLI